MTQQYIIQWEIYKNGLVIGIAHRVTYINFVIGIYFNFELECRASAIVYNFLFYEKRNNF